MKQKTIDELKKSLGESFERNAEFISKVIESINLKQKNKLKILDVGTGRGVMAILLALHGFQVITGEPEDHKWADWQTNVKIANVEDQITFQPFHAENLPFEDLSYDGIFLYGTFHHLEKKEEAIHEFYRVLKKNGILVILEFTQKGIDLIKKNNPNHPNAIDPNYYIKNQIFISEIIQDDTIKAYIYRKKN